MTGHEIEARILDGLTQDQRAAVTSESRRELVVAGAGSGKTEVMARRIAWWVAVQGVPKESVVALTFTEKAAEEMKFRVRRWIGAVTPPGQDVRLGGMFVGTIHGFCLAKIREYWPNAYHNYDILDEASRAALILRGYHGVLGLRGLQSALHAENGRSSQSETIDKFVLAYDQLHEHNRFDVELPSEQPPFRLGEEEREWCANARLLTDAGEGDSADAFACSAARYYAYLRCRRFLDFSTSQTEFLRNLERDPATRARLAEQRVHVVVDEVQDINPVQRDLIMMLVGDQGRLTTVGDHRQSIYGFRGAKVEIIGELWNSFMAEADAAVVDLQHNFRSTPRIIEVANGWAATITPAGGMHTPDMLHGRTARVDEHPSHVAMVAFESHADEAAWIAQAVRALVPSVGEGAEHDLSEIDTRGIGLGDVAVLVRSSTDVRTYMRALEAAGIPSVVRAGPDLFSQPEVLFMLAAVALAAGVDEFFGSPHNPKSLPVRINKVLGCEPRPTEVLHAAASALRTEGFSLPESAETRVYRAASALSERISGGVVAPGTVRDLRSADLVEFLVGRAPVRRVFPQRIFHWLLTEAAVDAWDRDEEIGTAAMFHLGTLSALITGMETPGWTSARDFHWQVIGLCHYGAEGGRTPEQPLIVPPDAVTISTVHGAKGLEFAAVFLADVRANRFPSNRARTSVRLPLNGSILTELDLSGLSDNENNDSERRLMYVALTRAERFLVVSHSGSRTSKFIRELRAIMNRVGGTVADSPDELLNAIRHAPVQRLRDVELSTSFSDMRYYLECPHDFYLRKVLGFSPTIDQAFGYGRGVHNLMRAVHSNPDKWAELADDEHALHAALEGLIDDGLFYLRYTTGEPASNMRSKAIEIVANYVRRFAAELRDLEFEPEKEFETLVEFEDGDGGVLVSGAVDIVRLDDPPRVTLLDFKSGEPDSDRNSKLDEDEMRLQVGIYAVAARSELEYEPERGLVRYLDVADSPVDRQEIDVPLDPQAIDAARQTVLETAGAIRDRRFRSGPRKTGKDGRLRCLSCDFLGFCGTDDAFSAKTR